MILKKNSIKCDIFIILFTRSWIYIYIDEIIPIYRFKKPETATTKKIIRFLEMPITYSTTSIIAYEIRSYYIKWDTCIRIDPHARAYVCIQIYGIWLCIQQCHSIYLILNIKYSSFLSMSVSHQEIWIQIVLNEKCKIWPSWYDSWKDKIRFSMWHHENIQKFD